MCLYYGLIFAIIMYLPWLLLPPFGRWIYVIVMITGIIGGVREGIRTDPPEP